MEPGPGSDRGPRQPAGIGQRLDRAGPFIQDGGTITGAAGLDSGFRRGQEMDRRTTPLHLCPAGLQLALPFGVGRQMQCPIAHRLAFYPVLFNKGKDQIRRRRQTFIQPPPVARAQPFLDQIRHQPEPGIHKTHITAGPAKPDIYGFQQDHGDTRLRQMQRRRQAGIAAANDGDIGPGLAGKALSAPEDQGPYAPRVTLAVCRPTS